MAKKLDPMDLKQIIRLRLDGIGNWEIGNVLDISRNTINDYANLFDACDLSSESLLELNAEELEELSSNKTTINNDRYDQLMLFLEQVHKAKHQTGFIFLYHYHEYKDHGMSAWYG